MQLANTLASIALLSLAAAAPAEHSTNATQLEGRQVPVLPCSTGIHVIAAGGRGSSNPPYGLLGSLANSITAAIPGSTSVSLPYDKLNTKWSPVAIPNGVSIECLVCP